MTTSTKITLGFMSGIALGGLLAWGYFVLDDESGVLRTGARTHATVTTEAGQVPSAGGEEPDYALGGNAGDLEAPDQAAGLSVRIGGAPREYVGWVVIYENSDGELGNALGATRFGPDRDPETVTLLRTTVPGETYYAVLHRDDGDREFSLDTDPLILDRQGNPLSVSFHAN